MLLRELANSGVRLPEIGFGTWNYHGGVQPLRTAIECGACFRDTAESYGTEEIVGEAIKGRRYQVFLATKVLPQNFRRRDLIAAAEKSLRRLGTDHIDLYQLHRPNLTIPIEEPMPGMEDLVDAGKVRFIGVSNFSVRDLVNAQAALSRQRIAANQVRYSLIERTVEGELLEYSRKNGITVIYLRTKFAIVVADPSRCVCGGSSAGACRSWAAGCESSAVGYCEDGAAGAPSKNQSFLELFPTYSLSRPRQPAA